MLNANPIVMRHSSRIAGCSPSFRVVHELIANKLNCFLDRADQRYKIIVDKFILRLKILEKEILESLQAEAIQLPGLHIKHQCKDAIDAAVHARNVPANVLNAVGVVEIYGGGHVFS